MIEFRSESSRKPTKLQADERGDDQELLYQGAEARVFTGIFHSVPVVIKERFEKKYRHPSLDATLTTRRIRSEVRAILRARAAGVNTPSIFAVDFLRRRIVMEKIEPAVTSRERIDQLLLMRNEEAVKANERLMNLAK